MTDDEMKKLPLVEKILEKGGMKLDVYNNTYESFQDMKRLAKDMIENVKKKVTKVDKRIPFSYSDHGEFEAELKFGGDMLTISMHTNVFEFPREHDIMNLSYIKQDITRSYCGVISMYNFLADSYKYNRVNDLGYLIARIFINKEYHYFVEGKRQIGLMYNNFSKTRLDRPAMKKILETAISYCVDFDLLTPVYDSVKVVSVSERLENSMNLRTGKRLGFRFQVDRDDSE
ncbi:MAG TPA: hypothetical protein PKK00_11915 [Bacteroidales bacterium]|nr:hypothetical protein [Bacteroidales bacterium]HPS17972.1 hypothetical protein [Bacteroidales bacterium]